MDCVQAMVEFRSVNDAQRVKEHLQGQDIYDHCCTMSVEFAYERVYKLKVSQANFAADEKLATSVSFLSFRCSRTMKILGTSPRKESVLGPEAEREPGSRC